MPLSILSSVNRAAVARVVYRASSGGGSGGSGGFTNISVTTTGGTYPISGTIDATQTVTSSGISYNVYSFSKTGVTYTINYTCTDATNPIYVMAIGGGGGGGIQNGTGGGGAGGMIDQGVYLVTGTSSITVTVGAGGAGAPTPAGAAYSTNSGAHGGNSIVSFASIGKQIIAGGGCGSFAGNLGSTPPASAYTLFGSGCGGSYQTTKFYGISNETGTAYYSPLTVYSYNGGDPSSQDCGGGGGAGGNATNATANTPTPGGAGRQCSSPGIAQFTGTGSTPYGNYYWAGGGGGGTGNSSGNAAGNGGIGGGGGGGSFKGTAPAVPGGSGGGSAINSGTPGLAGNGAGSNGGVGGNGGQYTGGGGGGSGNTTGGNGGQGIVVIAFPVSNYVPPKFLTPSSIAGNIVWLDASDNTTIQDSTNTPIVGAGNVYYWKDKSGVGNNYMVSNVSYYPRTGTAKINNINVIDVSTNATGAGSCSLYELTTGTAGKIYSIFTVGYTQPGLFNSTNPKSILCSNNNSEIIVTNPYNTNYLNLGTNSVYDPTNANKFSMVPPVTIVSLVSNSLLLYGYMNGNPLPKPVTSTSLVTGRGLNIGDPNPWKGYLCEHIMFKTTLSDIHRQIIEGYLAWRWGAQGNLPSSHYFYANPPYDDVFNYQFRIKDLSNALPATFTDASGSFTITNTGSVTKYNDTNRGYVFSFNGTTSYLSIPATTSAACTRTFWAKPNTIAGNVFSSANWPIGFIGSNYLSSNPGGAATTDSSNKDTTSWTFYACTVSGTTSQLYVNSSTTPISATLGATFSEAGSTIYFGSTGSGTITANYNGYLDDMRQYNRVLTSTEINKIYYANLR